MNCCVCGYHIFKSFWDAPISSISSAKHEDDPQSLVHNKYAIALINSDSDTVGHLPNFMSKLANFSVKYAGKIRCEITGSKRYSSNLEQGDFEIPAKILFQNSNKRIIEKMEKKLAPLIEEYNKKQLLYVNVIRFFKKISFIEFYFFSSQIRCALKLGPLKIKLLTRCALNN